MKKSTLNSTALFWFTLFLTISAHAESQIIWMGCGITENAFMGKIAEKFTQKTGIPFKKFGGGATKGIRLTSSGNAHIGGTCRHLLVDEQNNVIPEEANVNLIHVAWDALALIVHKDNPVNGITSQQVKDIYSGKARTWKELGGNNKEIILLVRDGKISGVGLMFRLLLLGDKDFKFPTSATEFGSSGPLEKNIVARYKNGIGVTGISSAKKRDVGVLEIDGVYPSKENTSTGEYPYFRPLYMAIPKHADENTKRLLDYILSEEGQAVISNEGTVNLQEGKDLLSKWHLTELHTSK